MSCSLECPFQRQLPLPSTSPLLSTSKMQRTFCPHVQFSRLRSAQSIRGKACLGWILAVPPLPSTSMVVSTCIPIRLEQGHVSQKCPPRPILVDIHLARYSLSASMLDKCHISMSISISDFCGVRDVEIPQDFQSRHSPLRKTDSSPDLLPYSIYVSYPLRKISVPGGLNSLHLPSPDPYQDNTQ